MSEPGKGVNIETFSLSGSHDLASADSLGGTLAAVEQMLKESEVPIKRVEVTFDPGYRIVEGELMYSAEWL